MLKFAPFQAAQSWYFLDPDNAGHMHKGKDRISLIKNIQAYRAQNRLPTLEYLDVVVEGYLCAQKENVGKCVERGEMKRGIVQYFKGSIALLKNLFYGEKNLVDQDTADIRSLICRDCDVNSFIDQGPFLQWTDDIALASVGERKSKYHEDLGTCECCQCIMKAKVFFRGPFHLSETERKCMEIKNPMCWQTKE